MNDSEYHVTTQRLFEYAADAAELSGREKRHLKSCIECQEVVRDCRRWTRYVPPLDDTADKAS